VILVVMMIYRPAGLIPAARRRRELGAEPASEPAEETREEEGAALG